MMRMLFTDATGQPREVAQVIGRRESSDYVDVLATDGKVYLDVRHDSIEVATR